MRIEHKKYPHYRVSVEIVGKDIIAVIFSLGAFVLRILGINTMVDVIIVTILMSYFGYEVVSKARKK